jgi:hypothetical protein
VEIPADDVKTDADGDAAGDAEEGEEETGEGVHRKIRRIRLRLALDPILEQQRQLREGSELSTLISKSSTQMHKYLHHPFRQTGLISEAHYGQLLAASRRGDQTTLKTALAEMLCVPISTPHSARKEKGDGDEQGSLFRERQYLVAR